VFYQIVPGPYMQVIGIAELDLAVDVEQIKRRQPAAYRAGSAHIHKNGRFHRAVHGKEPSAPRIIFGLYQFKHFFILPVD